MRSKVKILLARLVYSGIERAELGTWLALTAGWAATNPGVEDCLHLAVDACPTPVARHQVVEAARAHGCDVLVMVDADTAPHPLFLPAALEFLRACDGPAVLASPYVCGGANERVQVFRWTLDRNTSEDLGRFENYGREEAALKTGIERVACAGTGCFACHTEVFDRIEPPWFDYEYDGQKRLKVVCTEDIFCFRDLDAAGVPICCSWDHWAVHYKTAPLVKPEVLDPASMHARLRGHLLAQEDMPAKEPVPARKRMPRRRSERSEGLPGERENVRAEQGRNGQATEQAKARGG